MMAGKVMIASSPFSHSCRKTKNNFLSGVLLFVSVVFELKHNVCGRTIYAEGTADAVSFLDSIRTTQPVKRIYNMIDVLESGKMK